MQVKIAVPWGHEDGDGGYGYGGGSDYSGYGGGVFSCWVDFTDAPKGLFFWGERVHNRNEVWKREVKKNWGKLKKALLREFICLKP